MDRLNKYTDPNGVTFFLNPAHIVSAVVNRNSFFTAWKATMTDSNKATYIIENEDYAELQKVIRNGID